jgi:hypothetical protein
MSITIRKQPVELSPVYNQMMIVATSSNQTQNSFQFIGDIYCNGVNVTRMKVPVNPDGFGVFDLHKHIENKVSFDFDPNANYFTRATSSFATYSVNFSEEWRQEWKFTDNFFSTTAPYVGKVGFYGPTEPYFNLGDEIFVAQNVGYTNPTYEGNSIVVAKTFSAGNWKITTDQAFYTSSPTNSGTMSLANFGLNIVSTTASTGKLYAFNGVLSYLDYMNWDYTYYTAKTTAPYGNFLSTTPDSYELNLDSRMWLNLYQNVTNSIGKVYIKTNLGTYSISNTFTSVTTDNNRLLRIGVGPYQLLNATASITTGSYTLPVMNSTTTEMTIWVENTSNQRTIATKTFKIKENCSAYEKIQLVFLDKLGSFIPYTFNMVNRHNKTINKTDYQQHYGSYAQSSNNWNYKSYDRGRKTLDIVVLDQYIINSNWVNQSTSNFLMEMFESPEVYWIKEDGVTIAINIISNQVERKQTINDQVINYTLTFELANKNMTQRG